MPPTSIDTTKTDTIIHQARIRSFRFNANRLIASECARRINNSPVTVPLTNAPKTIPSSICIDESIMSVQHNINIIGGSQFTIENERLYNIAYLFRRNGTIEKQYKIHITPAERKWWGVEPGDSVRVFDTDRGKIAILICYDIEFPELARIAAAKGAKIIFVPFNTDDCYGYLRVRCCAQARAIENQMYVAIAGVTGNLPFVEAADIHYVQSGIYTPSDIPFARDAIASECTPNIETVIIHDVDIELLKRNRKAGTVRPWNDRRTNMYKVMYNDPEMGVMEI